MPKIFGIMLVKNESDIIETCLSELVQWLDKVFILDNGSDDGSWDIIQRMAKENPRVVPWKQDFSPFRRSFRAEIFNRFKHEAGPDDWWYIADSDEFFLDDPHDFLSRVPKNRHVVFKKSLDYFITVNDDSARAFSGVFANDRDKIKYLQEICWTEIRLFRHRESLSWPNDRDKPLRMGLHYEKPILIQHYQFRSPNQMQKRLDDRNKIIRDKQGKPFKHVTEKNWQELLRDPSALLFDDGSIDYDALPMKREFLEKPLLRFAKIIFYGLHIWK